VGHIDFKVISANENSNKFQKTRCWKQKSVEDMVTLECLPFKSSRRKCDVPFGVVGKILTIKFNGIHVVRSALRMWDNVDRLSSCYFVMGSHLQV
jgi:hypothetical protein